MSSLIWSVVGGGIAAVGAVLVAWPIARLSKDRIKDIAATKYDSNPVLVSALLEQRRYAAGGIVSIVIGVALQLVAVV